jgi:hypothetical protein
MGNDLYDTIKHIATMYHIKCSKYTKEELTPEMRDLLFDEAFDEYCTMEDINSKLNEITDKP